jgi:hypothetical protein
MRIGRIAAFTIITAYVALLLSGKVSPQETSSQASSRSFYVLSGFLLRAGTVCPGDQKRSFETAIAIISTPDLKELSINFSQSTRSWMEEGSKNFNTQALKSGLQSACTFAMRIRQKTEDSRRDQPALDSSSRPYAQVDHIISTEAKSTSTRSTLESTTSTFAITAAIFLLYFFPACVARNRKHANASAITALNIFLGWTVLGWVVAFVWSLTDNVRAQSS